MFQLKKDRETIHAENCFFIYIKSIPIENFITFKHLWKKYD